MKYKIATKKREWYDIPLCNHVNTYDIMTNLEKNGNKPEIKMVE